LPYFSPGPVPLTSPIFRVQYVGKGSVSETLFP